MNREKLKQIHQGLKSRHDSGYWVAPEVSKLADRVAAMAAAILEDEKTSNVNVNVAPPDELRINVSAWDRMQEVRNYARFHDISVSEAVNRLVNSGLSHEYRGWTS